MPLDFTEAQIKAILHLPGVFVFNPKDEAKPAQILGITDGEEASTLAFDNGGEPITGPTGEIAMSYTGVKGDLSITIHNISKDNMVQFGGSSVSLSQSLNSEDLTKGVVEYNGFSTVETGFEMAFFPFHQKKDGTFETGLTNNDMAMFFPNAMLTNFPELSFGKTEHTKQTFEFRIGVGYKLATGSKPLLIGPGIGFAALAPERLEYTTPTP
ncbi:MAG: hypothetical protein ACRCTS_03525 [Fusobacteriaceae bacterium]